jgi:hypothetical protein
MMIAWVSLHEHSYKTFAPESICARIMHVISRHCAEICHHSPICVPPPSAALLKELGGLGKQMMDSGTEPRDIITGFYVLDCLADIADDSQVRATKSCCGGPDTFAAQPLAGTCCVTLSHGCPDLDLMAVLWQVERRLRFLFDILHYLEHDKPLPEAVIRVAGECVGHLSRGE